MGMTGSGGDPPRENNLGEGMNDLRQRIKGGHGASHLAVVASGRVFKVKDEPEVGIASAFVGSKKDGVLGVVLDLGEVLSIFGR